MITVPLSQCLEKLSLVSFLFFCVMLSNSAAITNPVGQGYSTERYSQLWEKSPFSAPMQGPINQTNQDWLLTGITVLDNQPIAVITNKNTGECFSLSVGESSGPIRLVHTEWSNRLEQSFAIFEIDNKQQRLGFDSSSLNQLTSKFRPQQNQITKAPTVHNRTKNQPTPPKVNTTPGPPVPPALANKLPDSLKRALINNAARK